MLLPRVFTKVATVNVLKQTKWITYRAFVVGVKVRDGPGHTHVANVFHRNDFDFHLHTDTHTWNVHNIAHKTGRWVTKQADVKPDVLTLSSDSRNGCSSQCGIFTSLLMTSLNKGKIIDVKSSRDSVKRSKANLKAGLNECLLTIWTLVAISFETHLCPTQPVPWRWRSRTCCGTWGVLGEYRFLAPSDSSAAFLCSLHKWTYHVMNTNKHGCSVESARTCSELGVVVFLVTRCFLELMNAPAVVRDVFVVLGVDSVHLSFCRWFREEWSTEKLRESDRRYQNV